MKIGKISNTVLNRSVLKRIRKRGHILQEKPSVGADCAVLSVDGTSEILLTTTQGRWAVYEAANNIAVKGGTIATVQCGIIMPEQAREIRLKELISEIERQCVCLEIPISGGHTQVSSDVKEPIVQITGVGYRNKNIEVRKPQAGQEIVAVGCIGVSGVRGIVQKKSEEILKKYRQDIIDIAVGSEEELNVRKAVDLAYEQGVNYMHDVAYGGIWTALWDLAEHCNLGIDVDFKMIPVRQEIIELCELYGLNPYQLESIGGVLMVCDHGRTLVDQLKGQGIDAAVVGRMIEGNQKMIRNKDEIRYLESPQSDELEKI